MADEIKHPEEEESGETEISGPAVLDAIAEEFDPTRGFIIEQETRPDGITKNVIIGNAPEGEEEVSVGGDPNDHRTWVKNAKEYPYCADGLIIMKYKDSAQKYHGTGTAIDSKHVLTAGHVVYDHDLGGFAEWITFQPARNGDEQPYEIFTGKDMMTFKGWSEGKKRDWDMGMILLKEALPNAVKCVDTRALEDKELKELDVTVAGYPGDKAKGHQLWEDTGPVVEVNPENITYKAFTARGDSGAGVICDAQIEETKYQYATHTGYVGKYPKTGCRVSKSKKTKLDKWIKEHP